MSLQERATRIIAGKSTLENELRTASTTEWSGLCLITGRDDLLADEDRMSAWRQLDQDQQEVVARFNRSAGLNLQSVIAHEAAEIAKVAKAR